MMSVGKGKVFLCFFVFKALVSSLVTAECSCSPFCGYPAGKINASGANCLTLDHVLCHPCLSFAFKFVLNGRTHCTVTSPITCFGFCTV